MILRSDRWWHFGALGAYAILSWNTLAPGAPFTQRLVGGGGDAFLFVWFLAWWPWAISHHIDPFYTHLVWQPVGLNLGWTTSIPFLGVLGWPVTAIFGPIASYNTLIVGGPIASAAAAYALCLYITRWPIAAFFGGYFYGFSSYEMARASTQLNLQFTMFIPCLVLVILARVDRRITRWPAIIWMSIILICQFFISIEIFATALLAGSLAWLIAFFALPERRPSLLQLIDDVLIAGLIVICVLFPVLYAMFLFPHDINIPGHWPLIFSIDPMNIFVPTPITWFAGGALVSVSRTFPGFVSEQAGYFGVPLLVILWLYFRKQNRFLLILFTCLLLLSFGSRLWVKGAPTWIYLPWAAVQKLPLLGMALPARLMLYVSLISSIAVALYIAKEVQGTNRWFAFICVGLAVFFVFPAPHPSEAAPYSHFFEPGRLEAALGQNSRILILPFGAVGPSALWQAENKFGFSQTGGYLGYPPGRIQSDNDIMRFFFGLPSAGFVRDFNSFCKSTGTMFIVEGPGTPKVLQDQLETLSWPSRQFDDVLVLSVPTSHD